ncbi:HotDog domain-containing protein [Corynascus novoguineensis]|uniref:HotDog domain-containing protein n=1 Tax=Corynascus novoguineensis TaxID=1126955 RepID=A0AAN7HMX5_9PEZI|nr:HotDog domain-containing protein [Corynascus novoguineensis]
MGYRIQYRHLLRVAQSQRTGFLLPTRRIPATPSLIVSRCQYLQSFSSSPITRQEAKENHPALDRSATVSPHPVDSTTTTAASTISPPPPAEPSPPEDPKQHRNEKKAKSRFGRGSILLALASTLIGVSLGSALRVLVSPPNPPEPHTEEDVYTIRVLREQAAKLPIVQHMSAHPETWESWDAYESLPAEQRAQHISAGALAGSRGIGAYQRVFWNRADGELVSVIHFGSGTTGWPGVVHGGCLATILDESCGRAAFMTDQWGGRVGLTARLALEYKRATLANGFYVIRARVRSDEELPEHERGKRHYKCWVDARIEDAVTGAVNVTAEALFVGGKGNGKKSAAPVGGDEARRQHLRF